MDVRFGEVWVASELEPDPSATAWVPNPGQNFVIDDRILDLLPALRVIATPSTGRNHIDEAACARRGVAVFSLLDDREVLDTITASSEFTFLLLLNALRRLDFAVGEVSAGRWRSREDLLRGNELSGKRVGIVGFGRNGRRVARFSQAFDATVSYYDPYVTSSDAEQWPLERIFSDSDAVVVCCAFTPETTGMVGASLLQRMKPGAVLVNTSRGEVLVESELAELLEKRPDLRVAVDVLTGEVTNTHHDSPLLAAHKRGQIVVTPHIAGATVESQSKAALASLSALKRFFGAPVLSRGDEPSTTMAGPLGMQMKPTQDWEFNVLGLYNYRRSGPFQPMFDFIRDNHETIDGDIVDVGVYKAESTIAFAMYLKELGSDKKVFGYDSFRGFPMEKNPMDDYKRFEELFADGSISQQHWNEIRRYWNTIGFLKSDVKLDQFSISTSNAFADVSMESIERKIDFLELDNIVLVPGYFKDTMVHGLGPDKVFVANLDCDLYDGYKVALPFVWERLQTGSYIWLDEYYSLKFPGGRIATDEFFAGKSDGPQMYPRVEGAFERWFVVKA